MEPLVLVLSLVALAGIVVFVTAPLVHAGDGARTSAAGRSLETLERRDRAFAALRELEFDHRTGKITDEDYTTLLGRLRSEAAEALQAVTAEGAA